MLTSVSPGGAGLSASQSMSVPGFGGGPNSAGSGTVTIGSNVVGADIEIDGTYVGNTPTTLPLSSGTHNIAVRSGNAVGQRSMLVNAGSTVNVNAQLDQLQVVSRR